MASRGLFVLKWIIIISVNSKCNGRCCLLSVMYKAEASHVVLLYSLYIEIASRSCVSKDVSMTCKQLL